MIDPRLLCFSAEVRKALLNGQPIVALESTVISHGLPRPLNLEIALRVEEIIRGAGVVPATIAIFGGKIHVGLEESQIGRLVSGKHIHKISRRDLAVAIARKWDGATTVAGTAFVTNEVGIDILSTGGIGGVHRGPLPDVSADLVELSSVYTIVVCSGAKVVLDLPATRERLETHGITVAGYQCDEMPAFYLRRSGLPVDVRIDSPAEAAELGIVRRRLTLAGAVLVTVPVPEHDEVNPVVLHDVLDKAILSAERHGIRGSEVTPYLLREIAELSGGATLRANTALLQENARVAAEIALALHDQIRSNAGRASPEDFF